jgi:hypothetical protein
MPFAFTWDATFLTQPDDSEDAKLGAGRIRDLKSAIKERLEIDHSWAGTADDGLHLKVGLMERGSDPATVANLGSIYTKDVAGVTEAFYRDSAGTVLQITAAGALNLVTEQPGVGKDYWGSTLPAGYVWANGQTIGSATSGATGRANADTVNLFTALWNASTNTELPVSSGRGASAAADFAANKTITLPDKTGRTSIGRDTMGGAAATNRVTNGISGLDASVFAKAGGNQNSQQHAHNTTDPGHAHGPIAVYAGGGGGGGENYWTQGGNISYYINTPAAASGVTIQNYGIGTSQNIPPAITCNYIIKL